MTHRGRPAKVSAQEILDLLRSGVRHTQSIAKELGVSVRTVQRYLEKLDVRTVKKGMYIPSDVDVPSLNEYVEYISNSKSENVILSRNIQQDKTIHNDINSHNFFREEMIKQKDKKEQYDNIESDKINNIVGQRQKLSLKETAILILDTAKLDYSELELARAKNILKTSRWWIIHSENVLDYVTDAWLRFKDSYEKQAEIKVPVCYFMGIVKNILIMDMKEIMRSYQQFCISYGIEQKAAGAEGTEHHMVSNAAKTGFLTPHMPPKNAERPFIVPVEWVSVKDVLEKMNSDHCLARVKSKTIENAIQMLVDESLPAVEVCLALGYLAEHDIQGAEFFMDQIKYNNKDRILEAVNKNYRRYKRSVAVHEKDMDDSSIQSTQSTSKKKDRYAEFYELFPDS